uniref:hypothetical protein n=1 Tax=Nonomuraea sp. CA-252377 TaxID=3240003 RepID=UPI003F498B02
MSALVSIDADDDQPFLLRHHDPLPIEPIGDEPGRSSADGYWRTRTAAALAVARWHDPDLDPAPAVRQLAGGLDGGGPPR